MSLDRSGLVTTTPHRLLAQLSTVDQNACNIVQLHGQPLLPICHWHGAMYKESLTVNMIADNTELTG